MLSEVSNTLPSESIRPASRNCYRVVPLDEIDCIRCVKVPKRQSSCLYGKKLWHNLQCSLIDVLWVPGKYDLSVSRGFLTLLPGHIEMVLFDRLPLTLL